MPKMIAFGTLGALTIAAGVYAAAQQPLPTLHTPVQTSAPSLLCVKPDAAQPKLPVLVKNDRVNCYQDDAHTSNGTYISLNEINKHLEKLGLRTEISSTGEVNFYYLGKQVAGLYPAFKHGGEIYLDTRDLFTSIMSGFPIPVTISDAQNPVVQIAKMGNWALESSSGDAGASVYRTLSEAAAYSLFDFSKSSPVWGVEIQETTTTKAKRTIQTPFKAGEVIAAYRWTGSKPKTSPDGRTYLLHTLIVDHGTVDATGNVSLSVPMNAKFLTAAPTQAGDDVLLVKLTNTPLQKLTSGIFLPK